MLLKIKRQNRVCGARLGSELCSSRSGSTSICPCDKAANRPLSESKGKYAPARLGPRLCQGYKQPVICVPNRVIHALSAPKHMGHTEQR